MTRVDQLSHLKSNPRAELIRYLAGAMSDQEGEAFELLLIEDHDFSDAIEAAEFDLLEDFAAGVLSPVERRQITAWIDASPKRRARVLLAQALHRSSSKRRWNTPWIWWATAISTCIALTVAMSFFRPLHSPPTSASSSEAARATSSIVEQDTILLTAERLRGNLKSDSEQTYPIHADRSIRLQVIVPPADRKIAYSVTVQSSAPAEHSPLHFSGVVTQGDPTTPYLEVILPPGSLVSNEYTLNLRSQLGSYRSSFRVKDE